VAHVKRASQVYPPSNPNKRHHNAYLIIDMGILPMRGRARTMLPHRFQPKEER